MALTRRHLRRDLGVTGRSPCLHPIPVRQRVYELERPHDRVEFPRPACDGDRLRVAANKVHDHSPPYRVELPKHAAR